MEQSSNRITCPFCLEKVQLSSKLKENIQKLKGQQEQPLIFCDIHPESEGVYYCQQHKVIVCQKCAITNHHEHASQLVIVQKNDIQSYTESALQKLLAFTNRILRACDLLKSYKVKEKGTSSQRFMTVVKEVQDILMPHAKTQDEKQELYFMNLKNEILISDENDYQLQVMSYNSSPFRRQSRGSNSTNNKSTPVKFSSQVPSVPMSSSNLKLANQSMEVLKGPKLKSKYLPSINLLRNSFTVESNINDRGIVTDDIYQTNIGMTNTQIRMLKLWIGSDKANLALIYRGSRDGFSAEKFHLYCDGRGPTVTIVKSEFDQVFGGYTTASWQTSIFEWKKDPNAFLFSISQRARFSQSLNYCEKSIYYHKDYLATFGGGHDLCLMNNCNSNRNSYCNLGHTFTVPTDVPMKSEQKYLAGQYNFRVAEIEVYKVLI